jgi:hypothetical protein
MAPSGHCRYIGQSSPCMIRFGGLQGSYTTGWVKGSIADVCVPKRREEGEAPLKLSKAKGHEGARLKCSKPGTFFPYKSFFH